MIRDEDKISLSEDGNEFLSFISPMKNPKLASEAWNMTCALYDFELNHPDMKGDRSYNSRWIYSTVSEFNDSLDRHLLVQYCNINTGTTEVIGIFRVDKFLTMAYCVHHFSGFYITDKYRGKGFGRAIVERARDSYENLMIKCVNHYNQKFYEKCGFEVESSTMICK